MLPEDGSIRTWSGLPAINSPSRSAASTSDTATRSFTEPAGLRPSSLARIVTLALGDNALTSMTGV